MYKVKDNAEAQLQFGISSVATTLVVKEGQGVKFPEVPFLVVLNKRNSDWEITKSEKVEVSAVNGDQFTISRGFEWTTPSDFSADDFPNKIGDAWSSVISACFSTAASSRPT